MLRTEHGSFLLPFMVDVWDEWFQSSHSRDGDDRGRVFAWRVLLTVAYYVTRRANRDKH